MLKTKEKDWGEFAGMLSFAGGLMPFALLLALNSPFVSGFGYFLMILIWFSIIFLAIFCGNKVAKLSVAIWSYVLIKCSVSGLLFFVVLISYLYKECEINSYSILLALLTFIFWVGYKKSKGVLKKRNGVI